MYSCPQPAGKARQALQNQCLYRQPLAEKITKVYVNHPEYFDEEARRLFDVSNRDALRIHFTRSTEDQWRSTESGKRPLL